jgi:hypothetical protein
MSGVNIPTIEPGLTSRCLLFGSDARQPEGPYFPNA